MHLQSLVEISIQLMMLRVTATTIDCLTASASIKGTCYKLLFTHGMECIHIHSDFIIKFRNVELDDFTKLIKQTKFQMH